MVRALSGTLGSSRLLSHLPLVQQEDGASTLGHSRLLSAPLPPPARPAGGWCEHSRALSAPLGSSPTSRSSSRRMARALSGTLGSSRLLSHLPLVQQEDGASTRCDEGPRDTARRLPVTHRLHPSLHRADESIGA